MTLPFSTKIDGKANHFVEKILASFPESRARELVAYQQEYYKRFPEALVYDIANIKPKLHTLRDDALNRWHAGRPIQAVVCNRTPKRFQFAPPFKCVDTQYLIIRSELCRVYVQDKHHYRDMDPAVIPVFSVNDGFDDTEAMFRYFHKAHSNLKLIHWTDLKY